MFRLLKNKKNEAGRACNIGIGAISTLVSGEFLKVGEIFLGWLRFFFAAICTSQYSRQEKKLCEKESGHILKIHSIFFLGHPESCFKKLNTNILRD